MQPRSVTGISWHDKLNKKAVLRSIKKARTFVKIRYYKPRGELKETYFNPCSINLYDEDIVYILKAKGLMGLSMDLRIMGGDRDIFQDIKPSEKEFLSLEEFAEWETQTPKGESVTIKDFDFPYPNYLVDANNEINDPIWDEEDIKDQFEELNDLTQKNVENMINALIPERDIHYKVFKERYLEHLRFFVNQLFHIVLTAKKHKLAIDPWNHICIGSDFDGFIRAIDTCKNSTHLSGFGDLLAENLEDLAKEANIILPKDAKLIAEDILFNSAHNFIEEYFTSISQRQI